MAISDQINSFLEANIASDYGENWVDRSSFADMVTYLFYFILEIVHSIEQSQKVWEKFRDNSYFAGITLISHFRAI